MGNSVILMTCDKVQGFVRNWEFLRGSVFFTVQAAWCGGGGLHHKNGIFISFFFSHLLSILFFDDSSWPWLHLCGRRGTVGEVSVTITQWMSANSDHAWAYTGQYDTYILKKKRKRKTHNFTPYNCSVYYCSTLKRQYAACDAEAAFFINIRQWLMDWCLLWPKISLWGF